MDNAFAVMKEKIGFLSGLEHHGKTYDTSIRKGRQRINGGTQELGKWLTLFISERKGKVLLTQIVTELNSGGKDDRTEAKALRNSSSPLTFFLLYPEIDH